MISIAQGGELTRNLDEKALMKRLGELYQNKSRFSVRDILKGPAFGRKGDSHE